MARRTFSRVSSVTYFVLLMTWETVAVETPASRATSFMRILWGTRGHASFVQPPPVSVRLPPPPLTKGNGDSGMLPLTRTFIKPEEHLERRGKDTGPRAPIKLMRHTRRNQLAALLTLALLFAGVPDAPGAEAASPVVPLRSTWYFDGDWRFLKGDA